MKPTPRRTNRIAQKIVSSRSFWDKWDVSRDIKDAEDIIRSSTSVQDLKKRVAEFLKLLDVERKLDGNRHG